MTLEREWNQLMSIPNATQFLEMKIFILICIFMFSLNVQDLQAEIEAHHSVFSSLNDAGTTQLKEEDSKEEAEVLQQRLEDMNRRWNKLQGKSSDIR